MEASQASPSSLPGLTRQSIPTARRRLGEYRALTRRSWCRRSAWTTGSSPVVTRSGMRRRSIFLHCRAARLNPLPAATRRAGGDIDAEVLDLLASSLQGDFQFELVAAVEICGRTIEREQRRHFG